MITNTRENAEDVKPGQFLIYAKHAKQSMSASGLRSEVFAGPATIDVVTGEGTKAR
jgi:hypothetical protein